MSTAPVVLGVIADDFTGATDVAGMLVRAGMRTVQVIGVPDGEVPAADAVVVALKSRTIAPQDAVAQSLQALRWLQQRGARQIYFKYCSTFDSTPRGNIGPVTEALMRALDTRFTIACPAFPENGRTVFRGHLFIADQLLSDSGMRDHPLTPMTDANLVRVLQAQVGCRVGLVRYDTVATGAAATRAAFDRLRDAGTPIAVVDAIDEPALRVIGQACADLPLVTAGSGVALGLPDVYAAKGWLRPDARAAELEAPAGGAAVISGSCSTATNAQVRHWIDSGLPAWPVDVQALAAGRPVADEACAWAASRLAQHQPVLVYATAPAADVKAVQAALGAQQAGELVERCLASVARGLVGQGVRRLVVAGGETSGAVVQALDVKALRIGPMIDPGVPWTQAVGRPLLLALKSGNFGAVDFFDKALHMIPR